VTGIGLRIYRGVTKAWSFGVKAQRQACGSCNQIFAPAKITPFLAGVPSGQRQCSRYRASFPHGLRH
jgi:hypothetical protein